MSDELHRHRLHFGFRLPLLVVETIHLIVLSMDLTVMTRRICAILCTAVLVALYLRPATAETVEKPEFSLAFGTFIIGHLPLPVALSLDLFRAEGLDLTVQNFGAGGA